MELRPKQAMALMALCALLWSIGGVFVKLLPWSPFVICGLRSAIAVAVIASTMFVRHMRIVVRRTVILATIGIAGTQILFIIASKLTTSANAIILQSTNPVFIMLLSAVIYKKRYSPQELAAVAATLLGIGLFFVDQLAPGGMLGNLVALGSGAFMGVMYLFTNRLFDEECSLSAVLIGQTIAALVGCLFIPIDGVDPTGNNLVYILILGIVQLGIPYVLYAKAVRCAPAISCSLIGMIEPLLNPVWVLLVVGERPGAFALIGGAVVLCAVAAWSVISARAGEEESPRPRVPARHSEAREANAVIQAGRY